MSLDPNPLPSQLSFRGQIYPPYGTSLYVKGNGGNRSAMIDTNGAAPPAGYPYINDQYLRQGVTDPGLTGFNANIGDVTGVPYPSNPDGQVTGTDLALANGVWISNSPGF